MSSKGGLRVLLGCTSSTVSACTGSLQLDATLPGRATPVRVARFALFRVRPGDSRRVVMRLLSKHRKRILKLRQLSATLRAVTTDGQGLLRRTRVPVTLQLPGRR